MHMPTGDRAFDSEVSTIDTSLLLCGVLSCRAHFDDNEIRTLAFERAPTNKIRKAALSSGMKSLLADGRIKVLSGTTTAEEIVKVAQIEGISVA